MFFFCGEDFQSTVKALRGDIGSGTLMCSRYYLCGRYCQSDDSVLGFSPVEDDFVDTDTI